MNFKLQNASKRSNLGFSLIELLVTIAVVGVIGTVTTAMLFSGLTYRDRVIAETEVEESSRLLFRSLRLAMLNAQVISAGSNWFRSANDEECFSYLWEAFDSKLYFSRVTQSGCSPEASPSLELFADEVEVESLVFDLEQLSTGGYKLKMDAVLKVTKPFGSYEKTVSGVFTNLVD